MSAIPIGMLHKLVEEAVTDYLVDLDGFATGADFDVGLIEGAVQICKRVDRDKPLGIMLPGKSEKPKYELWCSFELHIDPLMRPNITKGEAKWLITSALELALIGKMQEQLGDLDLDCFIDCPELFYAR